MDEQALERDLRQETEFLADCDAVIRKIDAEFDVRGSDLSTLVMTCFDSGGVVSKHRRKQFAGSVPEPAFAAIQTEVRAALAARHQSEKGAEARERTLESLALSREQAQAAEETLSSSKPYESEDDGADAARRRGDGTPRG